jgi:tRNA (cytidine/uridine-2'-O-)-methyltransferase
MRVALYQPEIPGNVGAVLRLSACFGVAVDLIEPCGFPFSDKRLKRAGMDYADREFRVNTSARVVLLSSKATTRLYDAAFRADDVLLMGQESAGVPDDVRAACDLAVRIPLLPRLRSLNMAVATGIALSEALRQTGTLPA